MNRPRVLIADRVLMAQAFRKALEPA